MQGTIADYDALIASLDEPLTDLNNFCFVSPGDNEFDYAGEAILGNYACGITGATLPIAQASCVRIIDDLGFGMCVGLCGGPNNTELNCGPGYHCGRAEVAQAIYLDLERDSEGNAVACSGTTDTVACNAAEGFVCAEQNNGGFACSRGLLMCLRD